jgi:PAS domain S-box-containing protein
MNSTALIPETFELSNHLYYVLVKPDGYYAMGNAHFLKRFGLPQEELKTIWSFDRIHADDHAAFKQAVEYCTSGPGRSISVDLRKPDQKGRYIATRWELSGVETELEEEYYIQCVGYDVMEDQAAKQEMVPFKNQNTSKEELYEQLLSNGVDVFFLTNIRNEITFCSTNITRVFGYSPTELIGQNGFSLVHPDDLEIAVIAFEGEIKNPDQNRSVDIRFRKKDGSWLWTEAKGKNLFQNPLIQGMLLNLNEISLRKQSEQALQESEWRYKSFFNQLRLPLFVIGHDCKQILDVNEYAVERYGYTREVFLERTFCSLFANKMSAEQIKLVYEKGKVTEHLTGHDEKMLVTIARHEVMYSDINAYLMQVTDVTESYRTQLENELGLEISEILIQPNALNINLKNALGKIRTFTGWKLAELWMPSFDGKHLTCQVADVDPERVNVQILNFIQSTNDTDYPVSTYKSGNNPISDKPYWIEDIATSEFKFKRKEAALLCGFTSALAVPVVSDGRVICCFFFMSKQQRKYNRNETNLISILGKLFGAEIDKRKNSLMLDQFFLISKDILTIAGLDGRYKRVNPAFIEFSGYTAEEAQEIHPLSYVHDYDKAVVLEKLTELSRGEAVSYFENRIITKQGETKWIGWTATPLLSEGIIIASHRDITAQKAAAEALQISNERYEFIKNAANEAIWDYDLVKKVIIRSNGYKVLFGYDADRAHSNLDFWESKLHPQDRERVKRELHAFLSQSHSNQWHCEYRFLKSDGSYAFVTDKGYMIVDNDELPIRLVGSMQDVTEQKEFAEKLKISNERYELVTKATAEAIWDLDLEKGHMTWSEGYRILFGHGFEDAENGLDFWESNIHPDDRKQVMQGFDSFINHHESPHWESEYRFRRKDDSYANVLDKGYMIFNNKGKPVRIVGAMRDITERKKLEKELMLKERTRQFQVAQAAVFAQEKERAEIGKELHDNIGQLLTTTKLYLEMLKNKQSDPDELIDRGTKHINTIITEVRNLSRSLVPTSINDLGLVESLNDLVDSFRALGSFELRFFATNTIEERMNANVKLTIYRILQEQMNNIVRHSGATKVTVELFQEESKVYLFIADDGKGFDLKTVKKGQGLINIKSRAELQDGSVEILTNPGHGCKLVIQIPITFLKTT